MTTVICFLTRAPTPTLLRVAGDVAAAAPQGTRVAIMCDAPPAATAATPPTGVTFMHVSDAEATEAGYHHSSVLVDWHKPCIAWDKALYAFARVDRAADFVWFVEDDVFVPSAGQLLAIASSVAARGADYACQGDRANPTGDTSTWHWHLMRSYLPPPWHESLIMLCGMGRRLLDAIDDTVRAKGRLTFIEMMFNTLAAHRGLVVTDIPEIAHLTWNGAGASAVAGRFFHPVKDEAMYARLYGGAAG